MNQIPASGRLVYLPPRIIPLCLLILFSLLLWLSARAGLASLLYTFAASNGQPAAANFAVNLSPGDPEAHYLRGAVLGAEGDLAASIAEYNEAIARRPDDYVLWLGLAQARELNGQPEMAIAAAQQAISLAPHYAQTHWQLGNLLLRAGRTDEGFSELRLAGSSNPKLLSPIIDLAWQLSGDNVQFVLQAVQPATPVAHLAVAEHFKKRGRIADAIAVLRSASIVDKDYRRVNLEELLAAKRYADAYALWSIGRTGIPADGPSMSDPGFEQERRLDEPGFDWRAENKAQNYSLSLEPANAKEGKASLKVEFRGDSSPAAPIISQLVMVESNSRYQLNFSVRTDSLVSGGLPLIRIADPVTNEVLGQTNAFGESVANWQEYSVEFDTKTTTSTVLVVLQRQRCGDDRCPIFGRLWLDGFSIRKL